jgi:hypothetical protein
VWLHLYALSVSNVAGPYQSAMSDFNASLAYVLFVAHIYPQYTQSIDCFINGQFTYLDYGLCYYWLPIYTLPSYMVLSPYSYLVHSTYAIMACICATKFCHISFIYTEHIFVA